MPELSKDREIILSMSETKDEVGEKEPRFSDSLVQESKVLEQILEVEYGFLEPDEEVTQFLQGRIEELFPGEAFSIKVADNETEPNALAMPHGVIVVTKGLLELLETQDELDFVMAHEATHILKGHVEEINNILKKAKARYQTVSGTVADTQRLLGAQRLAEYEADIRGVMALTENKVNPAAAREVFKKLDDYQEKKRIVGTSLVHGTNVARMVNIGVMGALFDTTTTAQEQTPLPEYVKEYSETASDQWLYQEIRTSETERDVEVLTRHANLNEILLALRRSRPRYEKINEDPEKRKEYENLERFHKVVGKFIEAKIEREFPDMVVEDRASLVQGALALCAGVHAEEALGTEFEDATSSLDDINTEEGYLSAVGHMTPEVFDRLGIVIPSFGDTEKYISHILQAANENEVFINEENGEFDVGRYINFVKIIAEKFYTLSKNKGFEPVKLESLSEKALEEAILNLDLRDSRDPLFDLIERLNEAGVTVNRAAAAEKLKDLPSTHLTADELADLNSKELNKNQYLKLLKDIENIIYDRSIEEGENRRRNYVTETEKKEQRDSIRREHPDIHDDAVELNLSAYIENKNKKVAQEKIIVLLEEYGIDSLDKLKTIYKKFLEIKDDPSIRDINIWPPDVLYYLDADNVPFLSEDVEKRTMELIEVGSLELYKDKESLHFYFIDRAVEFQIGALQSKKKTFPEALAGVKKILDLAMCKNLSPEDREFAPMRMHSLHKRHPDNAVVNKCAQSAYDFLHRALPSLEGGKEEANRQLRLFMDYFFEYVDEMPGEDDANLVVALLKGYDYDWDNLDDCDMLLNISSIISEPNLRARLQKKAMSKLLENLDFDGKLELLLRDPRVRFSMESGHRQEFVEVDTQTQTQFDEVEKALEDYVDISINPEYSGARVVLEILGQMAGERQKHEIMRLCLDSKYSDKKLRVQAFGVIRALTHASILFQREYESIDDDSGDGEENSDIARNIIEADQLADNLLNLTETSRFAVMRDLLIGPDGFLLSDIGRKRLLKLLLERSVSAENTDSGVNVGKVLKEMLSAAVTEVEADALFLALAPILHENFLRRPTESASLEEVLEEIYSNPTPYERSQFDEIIKNVEEITKFNKTGLTGDGVRVNPYSIINMEVERLVSGDKVENVSDKLTPERFIVKLAESFGAPGVRFLQILGQYIDLPDDLKEIFADAYDNVKRQSKATSVHMARREWSGFREEVDRVIERRGGGSLMTSYECELEDGEHVVMKVLNANAEMFVKETMKILRRVFDKLVEKNPERYGPARLILDDLETWIIEDINDDKFLENDKIFGESRNREKYEGHDYGIYVPKSRAVTEDGQDNKYIKVEEYIDGKTLVRSENLPGEDMKQIASVIVKDHMDQILTPVKSSGGIEGGAKDISLVHSDVHPGNFMIFANKNGGKQVAILDRNNFLELNQDDRVFILSMPRILGGETSVLFDYIERSSGEPVEESKKKEVESSIKGIQIEDPSDLAPQVRGIMLSLKKAQVPVPLKLTLVMKNFAGLDNLAKMAGFSGLEEAYAYQP